MKMRNTPRRRRHFAPTVHQCPTNESPRGLVITKIASQRLDEERDILPERVKLVEQRLTRTKQITADFAVDLNHEGGFRFPVGVVGRQKIREQFSIFVNRIDRRAEEPCLTTQLPHGLAITLAITPDHKWLLLVHAAAGSPL